VTLRETGPDARATSPGLRNRIAIASIGAAVLGAALAGYLYGRHSAATSPLSAPSAGGPTVARFRGGTVPRAAVEAEIAKQPEVMRAALRAPAARKAFTEGLVRLELFAREAERRELQKDPEFVRRYKEALGKFYVEKVFEEPQRKAAPTDEEVRSFFEANREALGRPERARVAVVSYAAPDGDAAARAAKRRKAEAALARLRSKDDAATFAAIARAESDDPESRRTNGELPFATREELSRRLGPEVADAVFAPSGASALVPRVIETAGALHVVKVLGLEESYEPALEELKESIRSRLAAERRATAFETFLEQLWKEAGVTVDEKAVAELHVD
jgi:parvulin-like peptidyl-prolyl isomerase